MKLLPITLIALVIISHSAHAACTIEDGSPTGFIHLKEQNEVAKVLSLEYYVPTSKIVEITIRPYEVKGKDSPTYCVDISTAVSSSSNSHRLQFDTRANAEKCVQKLMRLIRQGEQGADGKLPPPPKPPH